MKIINSYKEEVNIHPDFEYDVDKHIEKGNHNVVDNIANELPKFQSGGKVSEIYEQKTGKSWETAKQEGLTDGSYENNIKLRSDLLSGKYDKPKESYESYKTRIGKLNPNLSVETKDYNLKGAYEGGLEPELTNNNGIKEYHLGSRNPKTGEILKSKNHPTYDLFLKGEKEAGYEVYEKDGKTYSRNNKEDISKATNFNDAFKIARSQMGANKIFEFNGKKYGTNVAGEKFEPDDAELEKYNLKTHQAKQNLQRQNEIVNSPYTSKEVTKLTSGYKNWESIKKRNEEINKMDDANKITSYHKSTPDEQYLIVDKKSGRMHLYKGDKLIDSFEVGVGENKGDAQTVTKQINGKTDWSKSNKSTGAGIYTISNVNPKNEHYYGLPSFNMANENGIEVSTAIHGTPTSRRAKLDDDDAENNRLSNGCINGKCTDLKNMYSKYNVQKGTKIYILPEDEGNRIELQDGKPILKVKASNREKYLSYTDKEGNIQKGQGINQSVNTLSYKPIKLFIDKTSFEKDVYQWNDTNDDKEYNETTKPFMQSLVDNKKAIMKASKISSDTYNELAKMGFGIYGTESNFGDTHGAIGNLGRAVNKFMDGKSSSSPDVKSKANTYGATDNNNSVGYTQIRWSQLNANEVNTLKELGVTSNKDFLDAKKAAITTVAILGIRYNEQLTDEQKKDVWRYLPTKWNNRSNYADRVKSNSKYLSLKQLQD